MNETMAAGHAVNNVTRSVVLAGRSEVATTIVRRMVGLLTRRQLDAGAALIIPSCNMIHTCFMRFPIDVIFLKTAQGSRLTAQGGPPEPRDGSPGWRIVEGVVVRLVERMEPFRFASAPHADTVIELPAGTVAGTSTCHGEVISLRFPRQRSERTTGSWP